MTYGDLMTLLLVFFVLLYTLTPGIDDNIFDNFISYFQSSVGVMNQSSIVTHKSHDSSESYRIDLMQKWEDIKDLFEDHGLSAQIDFEPIAEGVKITLADSLTFDSGSSELLPLAKLVLNEIAAVLDDEIEEAEVQGHTDNVPISVRSKYESNWHLGAARAVSVVQFIREGSTLDPARFKATSFGEYRPLVTNSTPEGRRTNRRVEIYVRYKELMESQGSIFEISEQVPFSR